jgi:hypothetical protein
MKTFLKIDCYLQMIVFFGYIIIGFLYGHIKNDFFTVLLVFYFAVGGFQLVSYLIKILMGFWSDHFMKIYGIMILPIWIFFLLNEIDIQIDMLSFIPVYGLFTSPFLAVAYLIYCRDKSENYLAKL